MKPTTTESGEAESQAREEVLTSSSTAYVLVLDGEMSCGRAARLFSRRPASRFLRSAASVPEIAPAAPHKPVSAAPVPLSGVLHRGGHALSTAMEIMAPDHIESGTHNDRTAAIAM